MNTHHRNPVIPLYCKNYYSISQYAKSLPKTTRSQEYDDISHKNAASEKVILLLRSKARTRSQEIAEIKTPTPQKKNNNKKKTNLTIGKNNSYYKLQTHKLWQ